MATAEPAQRRLIVAANPGPGLDRLVASRWAELSSHRAVGCLVCGARMRPEYGAVHARPVGGRCEYCGSTLT